MSSGHRWPFGCFASRQREAKTACRYENHGQDPAKTAWTGSRHGGGGYGGSGVVGFWKLLGRLQLLSHQDAKKNMMQHFLFCVLVCVGNWNHQKLCLSRKILTKNLEYTAKHLQNNRKHLIVTTRQPQLKLWFLYHKMRSKHNPKTCNSSRNPRYKGWHCQTGLARLK